MAGTGSPSGTIAGMKVRQAVRGDVNAINELATEAHAVHGWLWQRHVKAIELNVWAFNRGALAFYERLGYRVLSHRMGRTIGGRQ